MHGKQSDRTIDRVLERTHTGPHPSRMRGSRLRALTAIANLKSGRSHARAMRSSGRRSSLSHETFFVLGGSRRSILVPRLSREGCRRPPISETTGAGRRGFCLRDETGESRRFGASCTSRPGCEGGSKHRARHCPDFRVGAGLDTGQILASHRAAPGMRGARERASASRKTGNLYQVACFLRAPASHHREGTTAPRTANAPVRSREHAWKETGAKRRPKAGAPRPSC